MAYRYLGNKSKLSSWIVDQVESYLPRGGTVADPMCGTGAISVELSERGYNVLASDVLLFPTLHAEARLLHSKAPKFSVFGGYHKLIENLNELPPEKGYFYREFGDGGSPVARNEPRKYFTAVNAGRIDAIRNFIYQSFRSQKIDELEHHLLLHDLILAVNDVANIAGTYGYFRSTMSRNALRPLCLKPSQFSETNGNHVVSRGEASFLVAKHRVDAIYLDPPYTKRQYAGNYHILETIAREDEPLAAGDGGLRPWTEDASDFCYKRRAEHAFREILDVASAPFVFVSYSEDGQLTADKLLGILSDYGEVSVRTKQHLRYSSNGGARTGDLTEFLYCLEVR